MVLEAFHKEKAIDTKTCGTDLVTETDKYVEDLIIGTLQEKFPTHRYFFRNDFVRVEQGEHQGPLFSWYHTHSLTNSIS